MNTLANLQRPAAQDVRVDMFSLQGFELAQRIAKAFSCSDAVPVAFRSHVLKKDRNGEFWVENPAALGNCIVAIEVAQAVGMSVTAVMQNADVIQGKLRWSGKFVIAAINANRRFTPLEFKFENLGKIKATYKEKQGWNDQKKKFDFIDRTVEVDNIVCTAFAYMIENGQRTNKRIEGAPVSMKMVVEEGWYGKSDSKWQGEMKHLMFQYRAGSFFGNIHAPDIVMGMGRTAEEERDMGTLIHQEDGTYTASVDELKANSASESQTSDSKVMQTETVVEKSATGTENDADESTSEMTAEEKAEIAAKEQAEAEASEQSQQAETTTRAARTTRARTQANIE